MPSKESGKNAAFADIASEIAVISVSNNHRLKPFSESFSYAPANIVQQPLGNLFGFFEIRDRSDDSSYIVNFLTAVAKKEYYINSRRSPEDSFDAALHKVNVALSEIAKNGNINWLGKLEAAIGAISRDNFLFSVSGNAHVLLFRRDILNDISEGLAATEEETHPLKTFINVSSGQLKAGDKLIATSDDVFRVLSLAEIQKGALRFPAENFSQFLHTALVNRLETAETIIIDVFEKEGLKKKKAKFKKPEEKLTNVFSEKAFQKADFPSPLPAGDRKAKEKKDYIDKKTGHIYVREGREGRKQRSALYLFFFALKEKLNDFFYRLGGGAKNKFISLRKKWKNVRLEKATAEKMAVEIVATEKKESPVKKIKYSSAKEYFSLASEKIKRALQKIWNLFPHFSKIKNVFLPLNYKQRVLGLIILAVMVIIPLAAIKIKNQSAPSPALESTLVGNKREVLAGDKNINFGAQPEIIALAERVFAAEIMDETLFLISQQKIIQREKSGEVKKFDIPQNYGVTVLITSMKDLDLIFLLTDQNKMISWSPVSREFKENKITFPENARIKTMATYLTYLYLVDAGNNKIYRYPRAEGGFGAGASWLKEEIGLENISDIAIDENIYLADQTRMIKLFKGKNSDFNPEVSATPVSFNKVFTDISTANFYVLDNQNGRLVKFGKSGEIISQYYNEVLEEARDLAVDEKNNKAFITTSDGGAASLEL